MTFLEAKTYLCNQKLDGTYSQITTNDLFSDTDLGEWINTAVKRAWDYKPWDFTEGSKTGTTVSDMVTSGYADYPSDIQSATAYLLRVNGKEYKKLLFQDYLKYLEDYPTATDRIWSEQKRFIFMNANTYSVGQTFDVFGKLMPPTLSASGDLLPFSPDADNYEHSGNEAIVLLAYGEALDSEKFKNPSQAEIERKKAYQTLDILWKPFADAKSTLQSKNRPFLNVPDFFGPTNGNNSTGNFNYLD